MHDVPTHAIWTARSSTCSCLLVQVGKFLSSCASWSIFQVDKKSTWTSKIRINGLMREHVLIMSYSRYCRMYETRKDHNNSNINAQCSALTKMLMQYFSCGKYPIHTSFCHSALFLKLSRQTGWTWKILYAWRRNNYLHPKPENITTCRAVTQKIPSIPSTMAFFPKILIDLPTRGKVCERASQHIDKAAKHSLSQMNV